MPQLNTAPWLTTMLFAWSILLLVLLTQVINFCPPCELQMEEPAPLTASTSSWTWPW
uniref:ATP synthase F0 subunit 8 n=1 Tax=Trachonurus sulcatus TaxID=630746 RepID=UPI0028D82E64|nr:ATP synthase F0 subunit 8 [Trachonurus sulcatus]WMY89750.1 ATP synthase F0 subunit 8 [Trachonurus sulcatus]